MNDQIQLWNTLHKKGKVNHSFNKPTSFAKEVQKLFSQKLRILELGCGVGNDSYYFASQGHEVLGTDFSQVAIEKNNKYFKENNLKFRILDISKPTNFPDNSFDVIYAHLSLHYFTDEITKKIFRELNRILKPSGLLCFLCKSTEDPSYGKGKQIEIDMFEENGHIRHFFSENYVKECLKSIFYIQKLDLGWEDFYNRHSAFIKVIAKNDK